MWRSFDLAFRVGFKGDQIKFNDDNNMTIQVFVIKNNTDIDKSIKVNVTKDFINVGHPTLFSVKGQVFCKQISNYKYYT